MNKSFLMTLTAALLLCTGTALAAKPVKITPGSEGNASGESFRNFVVQCSNGKKQPLTAWRGGRKWCVGQGSKDNCSKRQIVAAQRSCKLN